MSRNIRNPPVLLDDKSYKQWKDELMMWQGITDLEPQTHALAVALSLSGKAR